LKKKGLPWEIAKAFDGSAAVGTFVSWNGEEPLAFSLTVNGEQRQKGSTDQMINGFNAIVQHISKYFTLEQGDLIYTGTPSGVGPVAKGDLLQGYLEHERLLTCEIR